VLLNLNSDPLKICLKPVDFLNNDSCSGIALNIPATYEAKKLPPISFSPSFKRPADWNL
jgi:hypothetical protein